MKKTLTIFLFIATSFTVIAQKKVELINWLNKEAESINSEKSKAKAIRNGTFRVDENRLLFSGLTNHFVFPTAIEITSEFNNIDAILCKRTSSSEPVVWIFLKSLSQGQQEHIELHFDKEKAAKKYAEKLIELAKLNNVAINSMPAYTPTLTEITDYLNKIVKERDGLDCYSNDIETRYNNELEITDQYIKIRNKNKDKQTTIFWKDMNPSPSLYHTISGLKNSKGETEFIVVDNSDFKWAILTMQNTIQGKPATTSVY